MADTLEKLNWEIRALIRTNKAGEYQCILCGRRAENCADILHTDKCGQPRFVKLYERLRQEIG